MGSSPGFVSTPCNLYALFRLAFATAPAVTALTLRQKVTRRLILQKARRHSIPSTPKGDLGLAIAAPTRLLTLVGTWFQVLFHSPHRGSFHLSLTVLVHYRSPRVFSLGRWSSQLPTGFLVSRGTQGHRRESDLFSSTGLSPSMVPLSSNDSTNSQICNSLSSMQQLQPGLTTPMSHRSAYH